MEVEISSTVPCDIENSLIRIIFRSDCANECIILIDGHTNIWSIGTHRINGGHRFGYRHSSIRIYPDSTFTSVFTLDGHTLHHEVHVKNCGDENMRCGIGFHPGFNIPFDENHTTTDYEIRFEQEESPIILDCLPHGLLSGKSFYQWKNTQAIPLTDTLFDNDSFCLAGLRSKTIGIYEKNSERKIICDISEYPYTLLWSAPTKPMRFICIEPWQSLPAAETDTSEWNEHAAAACIAPNESYSITLHTTFER